ncbi:tripartite tricarboxylate transporter substrate binding protein [Comamonas composti]|uniref:tripartite tricarboxylate transporter substrate binding protein n=1 Tax=Comamonas composti TaxID=408558 RepID=UPI001FE04265|nr:tripartite tricarboxylate transporter substrate binding protein [Comamonas composti]
MAAPGEFPNKPLTVLVSYPAGGSVDVTARILQEPLAKALGQTVIVDNRGGAGGSIGTALVAKAQPDGYTVLFTLSSHTINPAIQVKMAFDTEKDLAPVSLVASSPQVLVAHPSFAPSSLSELEAYARKNPEVIPYGSAGIGSPSHMAGELFRMKTGLPLNHVAYRGGGPATLDVLSGQIPLLWVSLPAIAQHIKSGRLKALAMSTARRFPEFPDVPAVAETIPGFNVDSWNAMFVPARTPPHIIQKIEQAVMAVTKQPAVQKALLEQGALATGSTARELGQIVQKELPMWRELTKAAQIQAQ